MSENLWVSLLQILVLAAINQFLAVNMLN